MPSLLGRAGPLHPRPHKADLVTGEAQRGLGGHVRAYSPAEHAAFKAISHRHWGQHYVPDRGPAQYAGGPYWPAELRRQAAQMERLIPKYLAAAAALEREIATDPRCNNPEPRHD